MDIEKEDNRTVQQDLDVIDEAISDLKEINSSNRINLDFDREIGLLRGEKRDLMEDMDNDIESEAIEDSIKEYCAKENLNYEEAKEKLKTAYIEEYDDIITDIVKLYEIYSDSNVNESEEVVFEKIYNYITKES
jgi:hypothetical protein